MLFSDLTICHKPLASLCNRLLKMVVQQGRHSGSANAQNAPPARPQPTEAPEA